MDVFDEGICDDILPEDWAKVERSRKTDGYKEGIAAGQESCLQQGFNSGFSQGTRASFSYSFIKGIINALITSLHSREQDLDDDAVTPATIQDLEAIMSELDSLQLEMGSTKIRCISSGDTSGSSKDAREKEEECQKGGKTTCCVDSGNSHNDPSSTSSAFPCHQKRDKVASGESTQKNASGGIDEEHLFYSQSHNPGLKKIVERLKPHLEQTHHQDILSVAHQFL
ncbi:uncharacterized protein LOC115918336 [Strongylocentrotus purpuratus]|uniref:Essential protein Yae1 N-terminal domain-containing protein n=1 Tax=Strongylocentrotus purpuratus TaxID=7668 RepID=A0A7M7N240_STRPU|nr:uncharacterized protein LOC115918336 [Strongylocentrotus purpuratus]